MGQALYRKYRPKKLDEIVGQEHITGTLKRALDKGAISHAYLFTGPHGVGKTSIARILAYEVNSLPYDEQATHLDIIEIDAASNRRIDEIRELRERVHVSPAQAKYKVYIIDEVHMLTKEAFNALLKTLEEPPAHAIFILATTEAHKLPETIISRTQRYTFKPIQDSNIITHLRYIADKEKISATEEALKLVAAHGNGSFRDSISLLDQAGGLEKVTEDHVRRMLGVPPEEMIGKLQIELSAGNTKVVIGLLDSLHAQGFHAAKIAIQLSAKLRSSLINGRELPAKGTTSLLKNLIDVPASHDPATLLEIILIENALLQQNSSDISESNIAVESNNTVAVAKVNLQKTVNSVTEKKEKGEKPTDEPPQQKHSTKTKTTHINELNEEAWSKILLAAKQKHNTLYSVMRMAKPRIEDDKVTLTFGFAFHQKRINDSRNKQIIISILSDVLGRVVELECLIAPKDDAKPPAVKPVVAKDDPLSAISNIFGDSEVIE
ncbi:DNA polymerase III subunit gamma/tau [soil metagenome]